MAHGQSLPHCTHGCTKVCMAFHVQLHGCGITDRWSRQEVAVVYSVETEVTREMKRETFGLYCVPHGQTRELADSVQHLLIQGPSTQREAGQTI